MARILRVTITRHDLTGVSVCREACTSPNQVGNVAITRMRITTHGTDPFFPCRTCMSRISDSTEMRIADHTFISTHRLRFGRCVRPKGCYKNRHSRE